MTTHIFPGASTKHLPSQCLAAAVYLQKDELKSSLRVIHYRSLF
jgi:hypothetical protein